MERSVLAAESDSARALSRKHKAAIIMRLMIEEGLAPSLTELPEAVQLDIARQIGSLDSVDRATLSAIAGEFANELDNLGLPRTGGVEAAISALGQGISPNAANRLRQETTGTAPPSSDPWPAVLALAPLDLVPLMEDESTEVAAVTLSKLPVAKAAEVLRLLAGPRARQIAHGVSKTALIGPDAVDRIGAALAAAYTVRPATAFPQPASKRMGDILNNSPANVREDLLTAMDEDDPDFASALRKAIFTFEDIPVRLAPLDLPKALRGVDQSDLVAALAHATQAGGPTGAAADFILSNMSSRMADQTREAMEEGGPVKKAAGEAAQTAVIAEFRAAADRGDITFLSLEADDD